MSYPKNVDLELRAPLQLPAVPGKPLTTQSGNTLDDGTDAAVTLTATANIATPGLYVGVAGGTPRIQLVDSSGTNIGIDNDGGTLVRFYANGLVFMYCSITGTLSVAGHINATPTTPALPANPVVSGTVYLNTTGGPIIITVPITATAVGGSGQWALGSTNTPSNWGGAEQIGVSGEVHNMTLYVPNNWYWSLTATSATIGTASVLGL
jgi:hypothetical protein